MKEKRSNKELFVVPAAVLGLFALSLTAFSRKSREEILKRDGYTCIACGARESLEASHHDHTRGEGYDDPENGDTLCTQCHLEYHIATTGENGLTISQNEWAIMMLEKRL